MIPSTLDGIDRRPPNEKYTLVIIVNRFTGVLLFELLTDFTLGIFTDFYCRSFSCKPHINSGLRNVMNCEIYRLCRLFCDMPFNGLRILTVDKPCDRGFITLDTIFQPDSLMKNAPTAVMLFFTTDDICTGIETTTVVLLTVEIYLELL